MAGWSQRLYPKKWANFTKETIKWNHPSQGYIDELIRSIQAEDELDYQKLNWPPALPVAYQDEPLKAVYSTM